jgi:hypothetical protein
MKLKISLDAVKHKQSSIHKKKCFYCVKKGHRSSLCTDKKRREGQKRPALQLTQALRKQGPIAVNLAIQVTLRMIAGGNICTRPHTRVSWKHQERSLTKHYWCATLQLVMQPMSCRTKKLHTIASPSYRTMEDLNSWMN